jgi:hypothetical protein
MSVGENEGCKPDPIMRKMASGLQPSNVIYIIFPRACALGLGFGHFTKTFVSQHVVWIHSFEPMMRNCMQRNKIAELVLGAPRETAEMANPQTPSG